MYLSLFSLHAESSDVSVVGQLQESFMYKYMHVACWLRLDKHLSAYVAYYTAYCGLLAAS